MLKILRFRYCEPYLFVVLLQPKSRTIKMRTTTAISTEMKVLMNHIYELHKGVRHMVLFTCNKRYSELAIQRLENQGIPYLLQPAGQRNLNVYFGRSECLEAIRLIVTRPRDGGDRPRTYPAAQGDPRRGAAGVAAYHDPH